MNKKIFALNITSLSNAGERGKVLVNGKTFLNRVITRQVAEMKDVLNYVKAAKANIIKIYDIKNLLTGKDVTSEYMNTEEITLVVKEEIPAEVIEVTLAVKEEAPVVPEVVEEVVPEVVEEVVPEVVPEVVEEETPVVEEETKPTGRRSRK